MDVGAHARGAALQTVAPSAEPSYSWGMNRNVTRVLMFVGVILALNAAAYVFHWGMWFY